MDAVSPDTSELALVIVQKSGKGYKAETVNVSGLVETFLRDAVGRAQSRLSSSEDLPRTYDPDADQDDAPFLSVPPDEIFDGNLIEAIRPGASLDLCDANDIKRRRIYCYAVVMGSGDVQEIYIRKRNPVQMGDRRLWTRLGGNHLDALTEPILAFDETFDVVVRGGQVLALDQKGFESLFKHAGAVVTKVQEWIEVAFHPGLLLADEQIESFRKRVLTNEYTRKKLQAVSKMPHVQKLTIEHIQLAIRDQGWDEELYIVEGRLNLMPSTEKGILAILNEDTFPGRFSGRRFVSTRKQSNG